MKKLLLRSNAAIEALTFMLSLAAIELIGFFQGLLVGGSPNDHSPALLVLNAMLWLYLAVRVSGFVCGDKMYREHQADLRHDTANLIRTLERLNEAIASMEPGNVEECSAKSCGLILQLNTRWRL